MLIICYAWFHALSACIMFIEKHARTIMYIEHYYRVGKKKERQKERNYVYTCHIIY